MGVGCARWVVPKRSREFCTAQANGNGGVNLKASGTGREDLKGGYAAVGEKRHMPNTEADRDRGTETAICIRLKIKGFQWI